MVVGDRDNEPSGLLAEGAGGQERGRRAHFQK
jgi:hypothetical protein